MRKLLIVALLLLVPTLVQAEGGRQKIGIIQATSTTGARDLTVDANGYLLVTDPLSTAGSLTSRIQITDGYDGWAFWQGNTLTGRPYIEIPGNVNVTATDLDMRNLTYTYDSVLIAGQDGGTLRYFHVDAEGDTIVNNPTAANLKGQMEIISPVTDSRVRTHPLAGLNSATYSFTFAPTASQIIAVSAGTTLKIYQIEIFNCSTASGLVDFWWDAGGTDSCHPASIASGMGSGQVTDEYRTKSNGGLFLTAPGACRGTIYYLQE